MTKIGREVRLAKRAPARAHFYDVVIIDCPPALNLLTLRRAGCGGHGVLVPMQWSLALEGLSAGWARSSRSARA